uniref:Putative zinc-finger domain-containing protein n=1 Tax=Sinocyclocheilus rhinocerous TaxID=307959 RepID=A0A673G357_9TELE
MEVNSGCPSPKEEGELEDGEIFDDEPQRQRQNARPPRRARPSRPMMNKRARLPGPMLNNSAPVPLRAVHPPFPSGLRQAFDSAPRSGFWERSHGALGRFRYRAHRASDWTRDWTERFAENHGCRTDSPSRKQKAGSRCQTRRVVTSVPKAETMDESFEDLLLKYKQIQLELECIRKEERMALKEEDEPPADPVPPPEEPVSAVKEEKKVFQAFNIRPLRQKLLTPSDRDALNSRSTPDGDGGEKDASQDDGTSDLTLQQSRQKRKVEPTHLSDQFLPRFQLFLVLFCSQAAKPKHSVSEKENNPVKSAEALPDAKKMEYRLLRDDMASLEKQRSGRLEFVGGVPSPAGSDSDLDVLGRAADLQEKLNQHKTQLCKDEALLKQLLQQEMKKKESLKAAEGKVTRLKEQLLASEKIVSANRVLLKKLQEQVQRVQHRVSVKKQQSVKLERDLVQAQAAAAPAVLKRNASAAIYSPVKVRRMDRSDVHYAELIAQKKRLQQLESEYALKIQKLKEAQALRQAEPRPAAPQMPSTLYPFPQPSLHDLTQDKLALSSEDVEAEEDEQQQQTPASVTPRNRRRSFRESGSFTKPKLCHLETPAASPMPLKQAKASCSAAGLPELLLGLNVEDLRQRYQLCAGLPELLVSFSFIVCLVQVVQVDFDPMAAHQSRAEPKPEPFGPYHSPLLVFKSYRFSPYYRTKEKLSLRSVTYSNAIEPKKRFCRFDLTGTCNDDDCTWYHMRDCSLTESQLFQDVLSYSLPLIGCADTSSTGDISSATEKYMKKLFGPNKDRMGTDQKAVLLVSKVNERLRHIPPFTTNKSQRKWRPEAQKVKTHVQEDEDLNPVDRWSSADVCVTQDDKRYFDSETDDISNLETSVLESPSDVQLWIKLAFKYLNQKDTSVAECLDAALNTLSRALEDNREDTEVWCHYLTLFSRRGSREEVQEMCEMAVEHAPHYDVWWTYMSVESGFEGKDYLCGRLVSHLLEASHDVRSDVQSFQLLESVLFRVQLSVFTGRQHSALSILKSALHSGSESSVADHLTVADRCLMWLSYIHLTEFRHLPACLYDPASSNPSRITCTDPFLIPWRMAQDLRTPTDIIVSLFRDAVCGCTDERLCSSEQIQACFPLHSNLIHLYRTLDRCQEALALCERLLAVCPLYCPLLEVTGELHLSSGHTEKAEELWRRAHSLSASSARVFHQLCKCLLAQVRLQHHLKIQTLVKMSLFPSYLSFASSKMLAPQPSVRELKMFTGLVHRCLETVPSRLTLPFSSSQYWSCFSFHNKVISFYLGCFPQSQHSLILERLQHIMPTNTELAIRLLQQEWQDGNVEHFKLQSRMLCCSICVCPTELTVCSRSGVFVLLSAHLQVQRLYQQALQKLPLSAALWKDCLLFEAAEGGKTDTLKKIIDKCQEVGVSLNEPLGLEPSQNDINSA